jgi:hypothetical protein
MKDAAEAAPKAHQAKDANIQYTVLQDSRMVQLQAELKGRGAASHVTLDGDVMWVWIQITIPANSGTSHGSPTVQPRVVMPSVEVPAYALEQGSRSESTLHRLLNEVVPQALSHLINPEQIRMSLQTVIYQAFRL